MQRYNPKIICNYYDLNNDLIMHFAKVYSELCIKFNAEFDIDDVLYDTSNANNIFCNFLKYMQKYIGDSTNINKNLLEQNINESSNLSDVIEIIKSYNIIYDKIDPPLNINEYNIYHVGNMMYYDEKPCIMLKEFKTLCFLSCSLKIVDQFMTKDRIIYEIKVNIKQPVLFLFDNSEQLECLLLPNTNLKVLENSDKLYKNEKVTIIKLELL